MSDTTELPVPSNITPEKGLPTGTPVKRAKADDTRHLLTCAGFEEEEIQYLFKAGLSSPERIILSYEHSRIDLLLDQDVFPQGCITAIMHVAQYLQWYWSEYGSYNDLRTKVTEESIINFRPNLCPQSKCSL